MKRSARHDTRRRQNDERHSRAVLALLSKMRARGRVVLEELSVKGRLQLMEYDATQRQRDDVEKKEDE